MDSSPPKIDNVEECSLGSSGDSSYDVDDGDDELCVSENRHDGQSTSEGSAMEKEMAEIETLAREDTNMLLVWRRIVTLTMMCTFVAILSGAIIFLKKEEDTAIRNDVSQSSF